jgi:IS30 family transposase
MARKRRIHYTETDKAVMWDRWQKGDSLEKIAQLFDRSHGSVARILRQTGGIRPPKRVRSGQTLSLAEREEISRGVVSGRSFRSIASSWNRAPSTISREINRNGGRQQY